VPVKQENSNNIEEENKSSETDDTSSELNGMLSTLDNPFNPFTQYNEWYNFDVSKGYHSCAYLARIVKSSEELSELDESLAIEQAIDEIIEYNILGMYIKVTPTTFVNRSDFFKKNPPIQ
jgi:hypothetical protein